MQNNKIYILGVSSLFCLQVIGFYNFKNYFEPTDSKNINFKVLLKKNKSLQAELDLIKSEKKENSRQIASIPNSSNKKIDLTEFYFSQLETFKKNKNKDAFLEMIEKIQNMGATVDISARAEFEKINFFCDYKISLECTQSVDNMVTQFPDSNWTAKSLLVLSHFYFQQNKLTEAKALLQIIRSEFKTYKEFAYDIKQIKTEKL